jgi:glycosyltransferase Alg8
MPGLLAALPELKAAPLSPRARSIVLDVLGWIAYVGALFLLVAVLPRDAFVPGSRIYVFAIGMLGVWRYGLRGVHFVRSMVFLHWTFPRHRRAADRLEATLQPSQVYILVTSFRIETATTALVYRAVMEEAIACEWPVTIVASIVEMGDQRLILDVWERYAPPDRVRLKLVRIAGTGKRDGLALGFRSISRDMPAADAVVAVVDGDTLLEPGVLRRTVPFLALMPDVGGLTTNEFCKVEGSYTMSEWHKMRFAQRHLNMCSMALTKRVLTLTGRMSLFRADIVTDARFIHDVQHDALDHWRLGRFKFLTGDDKSTWYSLMRLGWDTYYVPDAAVSTVEHPPDRRFLVASRQLMFRWYGNSLRQNSRALGLGPSRLGWFTYYVLFDQRILMWTGLLGLALAIAASLQFSVMYLLAFLLWVGITRLVMSFILIASGHRVGPLFPILLYYNQVVGSLTKISVFFNLDRQSWTRQKTTLDRDLDPFQRRFNRLSSLAMVFSAASVFAAIVLFVMSF